MNEYLEQIFAAAGEQDIDPDVAAAGALLSKVAEEQGIDLDEFSDEEIGGMLQDIMGSEDESYADEGHAEPKVASEITVADVSAELAKTAAAEGIDLASLDREQYHQAFNWQLEQMQDPSYFETKIAMQEKVAEADMLGRVMAHSFNDELEKIAGVREMANAAKGMARKGFGKARSLARRGGAAAAGGARRGGEALGRAAEAVGKRGPKSLVHGVAKRLDGPTSVRLAKARKIVGGTALGTGALAAGAGIYGAKKLYDRRQEKTSGLSEEELLLALTEYGWDFE